MPKNPTRVFTDANKLLDFGEAVPFALEMSKIEQLITSGIGEVTPQGIQMVNGQTSVKLLAVQDADGHPVTLTAVLRITRSAATQDEIEAVQRKADERDGNKAKRDGKEADTREREIMRATKIVKDTMIEAQASRGSIADQIKDSLAIMQALGAVTGHKQLGQ